MSLLQNPDFESGLTHWFRNNNGESVDPTVVKDNGGHIVRSGTHYLKFKTSILHGSMAQDITVTMPSVTALAYLRAESTDVSGRLTIWDLDASDSDPHKNNSTPFKGVGQNWTQIIAILGLNTHANRHVRIELYLDTADANLFVDCVAAF